jgi:hypothetical protein
MHDPIMQGIEAGNTLDIGNFMSMNEDKQMEWCRFLIPTSLSNMAKLDIASWHWGFWMTVSQRMWKAEMKQPAGNPCSLPWARSLSLSPPG